MSISPVTLTEEVEEEKLERQVRTGVISNGLTVVCHPDIEQPDIEQKVNRAICLVRPYSGCKTCVHSTFSLVFRANKDEKYQQVACPRWEDEKARLEGEPPDKYVPTEEATCLAQPFSFCSSCPSRQKLRDAYSTDKSMSGWFGRWKRLREDELAEELDGRLTPIEVQPNRASDYGQKARAGTLEEEPANRSVG
jgi:hypothetical protein